MPTPDSEIFEKGPVPHASGGALDNTVRLVKAAAKNDPSVSEKETNRLHAEHTLGEAIMKELKRVLAICFEGTAAPRPVKDRPMPSLDNPVKFIKANSYVQTRTSRILTVSQSAPPEYKRFERVFKGDAKLYFAQLAKDGGVVQDRLLGLASKSTVASLLPVIREMLVRIRLNDCRAYVALMAQQVKSLESELAAMKKLSDANAVPAKDFAEFLSKARRIKSQIDALKNQISNSRKNFQDLAGVGQAIQKLVKGLDARPPDDESRTAAIKALCAKHQQTATFRSRVETHGYSVDDLFASPRS